MVKPFVRRISSDYVRINPVPNAEAVLHQL
jgi:hypothetical protein